MNSVLSAVLIVACLLVVAWTVGLAVRNRPVGVWTLGGLAVLEVLVLLQAVVAVVEVIGGDRPPSVATFLGYAIGALLILPVGTLWSLAERSRSSTLVLTVACLALPVMTARMLQMWAGIDA